jgi:hypothetical protein
MSKKDILVARDGVSEVMTTFLMRDAVKGLKILHDCERKKISDVIFARENTNCLEVESMRYLRIQIDEAAFALEEEKNASASAQE